MRAKRWLPLLTVALLLVGCSQLEALLSPGPAPQEEDTPGWEDGQGEEAELPLDMDWRTEELFPWEDGDQPERQWAPAADSYSYGREFLTPGGRLVYDALCESAQAVELGKQVPVPPEVSDEEARQLVRFLWDDNPCYYWAVPILTTTQPTGERTLHLELAEGVEREEVLRKLAEAEAAGERMLEGLSGSDYQVALELHDRLAGTIEYNKYSQVEDMNNIYGALVNRSAVCDGYSKAYQYLLGRLGIPCIYLVGQTDRGLPHSWNALYLDGAWYYTDLTWDDVGYIRRDYFLNSKEEFHREHTWDQDQYPSLPPESEGAGDYYQRSGYLIRPDHGRDELVSQFVSSFFRQMVRGPLMTDSTTAYLEVKVQGSRADYEAVKAEYMEILFDILGALDPLLRQQEGGLQLATVNEVSCNFNDEMHILTLHPQVTGGESEAVGFA